MDLFYTASTTSIPQSLTDGSTITELNMGDVSINVQSNMYCIVIYEHQTLTFSRSIALSLLTAT